MNAADLNVHGFVSCTPCTSPFTVTSAMLFTTTQCSVHGSGSAAKACTRASRRSTNTYCLRGSLWLLRSKLMRRSGRAHRCCSLKAAVIKLLGWSVAPNSQLLTLRRLDGFDVDLIAYAWCKLRPSRAQQKMCHIPLINLADRLGRHRNVIKFAGD
jgi:hypothetical protein